MAESKPEQIVAAMQTALRAFTADGGSTYWYEPSLVPALNLKAAMRFPELTEVCFDASLGSETTPAVIYILAPGQEVKDGFTFRNTGSELRVDLAAFRHHTAAESNPFVPPSPSRWTVQNRLARDVEKALTADRTLGGLALTLDVEAVDRVSEDVTDDAVPWAVVFLRVVVLYEHADGTP